MGKQVYTEALDVVDGCLDGCLTNIIISIIIIVFVILVYNSYYYYNIPIPDDLPVIEIKEIRFT